MAVKTTAKKAAGQRKKRTVSDQHKAAMAEGRTQSRAVARYLDAVSAHKPKRGRKRTPESIDRRLAAIAKQLDSASRIKQLSLLQERMNLQRERETLGRKVDLSGLEKDFVAAARSYGERKGISYGAWRELGVDAETLKKAGISRGRG